jgi:tetratricopeptide (TPR) repeat protein
MADIAELTEYVKNHGTDHDARWKLCKKLFEAGEYDRAAYHLEIVKQYKVENPNVVRYLAASYYRLKKYNDAVTELRNGVKRWPKETGLHEQLGRVLRIAGRLEEAREAWKELARLEPEHPIAAKMAAKTDREIAEAVKKEPEPLRDSELGLGQAEGRLCPTCGAVNTEEFERCWKCHSYTRMP